MLLFGFELASTPIMEQSPKNVTVLDGKDATIVCRAIGAPQPNVTWTYNGKISIYIGFCMHFMGCCATVDDIICYL